MMSTQDFVIFLAIAFIAINVFGVIVYLKAVRGSKRKSSK
jgi:hypothetical protein